MHKSKLIEHLKGLDHREVRRFQDFLRSPYFNKNQRLTHLFEIMLPCAPDYVADNLSRAHLMAALYGSNGTDAKLNADANGLLELFKVFMVHEQVGCDDVTPKRLLAQAYASRGMTKRFLDTATHTLAHLKGQPSSDARRAYLIADLSEQVFFHPVTQRERSDAQLLEDAMLHLEEFYLLTHSRLLSEALIRRNVYAHHGGIKTSADGEVALNESAKPGLALYRQLVALLKRPDEKPPFEQLIASFEQALDQMSDEDKSQIAGKIFYACNYYYERRDDSYLEHMFKIVQLGHERDFMGSPISPALFVNVCSVACSLGRHEWAEGFMESRARELPEEHREASLALGRCYKAFHSANYKLALDYLHKASKSHLLHRVQIETLYLRTYCEMTKIAGRPEYSEEIERCRDRFYKYLQADNFLAKHRKDEFKAFTSLAAQLAEYYGMPGGKRREGLKERITVKYHKDSKLACTVWLAKHVEAL